MHALAILARVRKHLAALGIALVLAAGPAAASTETVGHSVRGRAIQAIRVGDPDAKLKLLVVAVIHGNERAGLAVTRRLRRVRPPRGTELWLVDRFNPDGAAANTRQNARGVDLNRNFPEDWRGGGRPFDTYYAGPRPLSEPESQAIAALVRRIKPRVTLWYHQHLNLVTKDTGGDPKLEGLYARRSGLRHRRLDPLPGTITAWQNSRFRRDTAFVVELPAGSLSKRATRRHSRAVLALARAVAPVRIHDRLIPGARPPLEEPTRIVIRFGADKPCTHFLVERSGRIFRQVPLSSACLDDHSVVIDHEGQPARASLRLVRQLQGRLGIRTARVIGAGKRYRARLRRLPSPDSVR